MPATTLHYIHDPLCGWCYAAAPLVEAARDAGVPVALHGGGLWQPATRLGPDKRPHIRDSDARIAALTGMPFGPGYLDGLLADPDTLFWSRPTIAAILAATKISPDAGPAMLHAIQRAHYVEGRRVVEPEVLADVAGTLGLDPAVFLDELNAAPVDRHIAATRERMQRHDLGGFPGFLLERGSETVRIAHEPFYGQPHAFVRAIDPALATRSSPSSTSERSLP